MPNVTAAPTPAATGEWCTDRYCAVFERCVTTWTSQTGQWSVPYCAPTPTPAPTRNGTAAPTTVFCNGAYCAPREECVRNWYPKQRVWSDPYCYFNEPPAEAWERYGKWIIVGIASLIGLVLLVCCILEAGEWRSTPSTKVTRPRRRPPPPPEIPVAEVVAEVTIV
jgi:hypothetical protein